MSALARPGGELVLVEPGPVGGVGDDRHVADPAQRRQVGVVVVQVAEQHDVDVVDVLLHRQVAAPAQRADAAPQERVGEHPQAAQLEQHGRVPHPGGAHAAGARGASVRLLCHDPP